jgi:glycerate 2-kinase
MPLQVLVVPDKFKGTLSAGEAARAIARGWKAARPSDRLALLPMSDGGDGFGEAMAGLLRADRREITAHDAAGRKCTATWWWMAERRTAIVESARIVGLAMLPAGKFHPLELDTFGLGEVLVKIAARGARRCILGIGGSATNDAGFGLARALGWEFVDRAGAPILRWVDLAKLHEVRPPASPSGGHPKWFRDLRIAVDVQNPLLGPKGATRIYGPQKGIRTDQFAQAETALRQLARVVRKQFKYDYAVESGAGAAGGLGFGLRCFAGGSLQPGFQLLAGLARLDEHMRRADLVITGEGSLDRSSLMGKGVGQISSRCRKLGIPCIALAGTVALPENQPLFHGKWALTDLASAEETKARPGFWLEALANSAATAFSP